MSGSDTKARGEDRKVLLLHRLWLRYDCPEGDSAGSPPVLTISRRDYEARWDFTHHRWSESY